MNKISLHLSISRGFFSWVYKLGLGAGVVSIALLIANLGVSDIPRLLLYFSVGHVVFLSLIAFFLEPSDRGFAGNKIQSAGYLYTLIGFAVLLAMLKDLEKFSMVGVLPPMGTALYTSIVGWFFGAEIAESTEGKRVSIRGAAEDVAGELASFTTSVREVHYNYLNAIHALTRDHIQMREKQREALNESIQAAVQIGARFKDISSQVEDFGRVMERISFDLNRRLGESFYQSLEELSTGASRTGEALKKAATEAQSVSEYLSQSRLLVEETKRLIDFIVKTSGGSEK